MNPQDHRVLNTARSTKGDYMKIKNAVVLIEFEEVEGTRAVILDEDQQQTLISLLHYVATPLRVTDEVYDSIKFTIQRGLDD